ncbi:MAG: HNH endonuclease [Gammaproteobacteria bacterium]
MTENLILRLDITCQPIEWIHWQTAACLYARKRVSWDAGETVMPILGGVSKLTGERSQIALNSIIVVRGTPNYKKSHLTPPLTNRELFARDRHICLYCGEEYPGRWLTRDHVMPRSKGGLDVWENVVTACKPCNEKKGARRPEQARMPLLAVPFAPNRAEYLALLNRKILADQMEFLKLQFRKGSRLLE